MGDILDKIKQANLTGRGGASFPVASKWQAVKQAAGEIKYVLANASEGEPGVLKDGYILEHYPDKVVDGMKIAVDFLGANKAFLYLNHAYFKKFNKKLTALVKGSPIEIFSKPIDAGYIGGEESAALNALEGRRVEPRLKPPFPTSAGFWGQPTLINNVETFYDVSLVNSGDYQRKKFYSITGDCPREGVFELPEDQTIEKILKITGNYPRFDFFVQSGGARCGLVLNNRQLKQPVCGAGSITVYSLTKNNPRKAIKGWLDFFVNESCGQCAPCREGLFCLRELFLRQPVDWPLFNQMLDNLADSTFCALGASAVVPLRSFRKNVLPYYEKNKN